MLEGRSADPCTVVLWLIAATIVRRFWGGFWPHFHSPFSVGARALNGLFHWVFCDFGSVFERFCEIPHAGTVCVEQF
jgi:hypothetical protein